MSRSHDLDVRRERLGLGWCHQHGATPWQPGAAPRVARIPAQYGPCDPSGSPRPSRMGSRRSLVKRATSSRRRHPIWPLDRWRWADAQRHPSCIRQERSSDPRRAAYLSDTSKRPPRSEGEPLRRRDANRRMDWPWPALCAFYRWAQCAVTTRGGDAFARRNDSFRYPRWIHRPFRSRSGRHTRVDTTPRIRLACPTTRCNSLTRTAKRSTQTTRRSKVGPWTRRRDHPGQLGSALAHGETSETLRKWVWVGATMPGQTAR